MCVCDSMWWDCVVWTYVYVCACVRIYVYVCYMFICAYMYIINMYACTFVLVYECHIYKFLTFCSSTLCFLPRIIVKIHSWLSWPFRHVLAIIDVCSLYLCIGSYGWNQNKITRRNMNVVLPLWFLQSVLTLISQ